jgi:hypothetical protein
MLSKAVEELKVIASEKEGHPWPRFIPVLRPIPHIILISATEHHPQVPRLLLRQPHH